MGGACSGVCCDSRQKVEASCLPHLNGGGGSAWPEEGPVPPTGGPIALGVPRHPMVQGRHSLN